MIVILSKSRLENKSKSPASHPLIDPNYWADPFDKEMSLRGLKVARDIMQQKALTSYIAKEALPGGDVKNDQQLFDYACGMAKTQHHPAGTCTKKYPLSTDIYSPQ